MTKELYYTLAFTSGLLIAVQAGVNSQLRMAIQHPVLASLISFLVGSAALVIAFALSARIPSTATPLMNVSAWKFIGGLLGAVYIFSVIIVAPKIGAANTLCFAIAGQLVSAVVLDHFGWVGFPVREISWSRMGGAALIILGVYLVQKN